MSEKIADGRGDRGYACLYFRRHLRGIIRLVHQETKAFAFHSDRFGAFSVMADVFSSHRLLPSPSCVYVSVCVGIRCDRLLYSSAPTPHPRLHRLLTPHCSLPLVSRLSARALAAASRGGAAISCTESLNDCSLMNFDHLI